MTSIHTKLTPAERAMPVRHYIDPGFVNERLIETLVGESGIAIVNEMMRAIPADTPDWVRHTQIHHIYTRVALLFCEHLPARSLRQVLAAGKGLLVCSTELLAPCPEIYDAPRAQVIVMLDDEHILVPELHFTTSRITSDTLRSRLQQGGIQSFIAEVDRLEGHRLILHPLVIGSPWLETSDPNWADRIPWWAREFYEHFVEDFDEFSLISSVPKPTEFTDMAHISEQAFKTCLAELLGDQIVKDWGGEHSDHYTAHIHLQGKRVTAAFLFKGPARFQPMTLNNLGKNNDQIVRLAEEPADVLFVQHCHDITQPVRTTLRAFAVQPSRPRRYCLMDGRDSLQLLMAYGKVDRAKELTTKTA